MADDRYCAFQMDLTQLNEHIFFSGRFFSSMFWLQQREIFESSINVNGREHLFNGYFVLSVKGMSLHVEVIFLPRLPRDF